MKPKYAYLIAAVCIAISLASCATTVTTTTLPDGTIVTITAKSTDKDAINGAIAASELILPYVIHPAK